MYICIIMTGLVDPTLKSVFYVFESSVLADDAGGDFWGQTLIDFGLIANWKSLVQPQPTNSNFYDIASDAILPFKGLRKSENLHRTLLKISLIMECKHEFQDSNLAVKLNFEHSIHVSTATLPNIARSIQTQRHTLLIASYVCFFG